jgi:hypothetical protein
LAQALPYYPFDRSKKMTIMAHGQKLIWPLLPAFALLLTACGATLQVLDKETTSSLLPWLEGRPTRAVVAERMGDSWQYTDGPTVIYSMAQENDTLVPADERASYELVLVFDEQEHLHRYSLIRVR